MESPSLINNKTVVLKKSPTSQPSASPSIGKSPDKQLAVKFSPVKPCGTYVIKSVNRDLAQSPTKEDDEKNFNGGSLAQGDDVVDDVEELKLDNEVISELKNETSHSAWSEESQRDPPKSPTATVPVVPPKPSSMKFSSGSSRLSQSKEKSKCDPLLSASKSPTVPPKPPSIKHSCQSPRIPPRDNIKSPSKSANFEGGRVFGR